LSAIEAAASATPVALKVTEERPLADAVSVFAPSPVPSFQEPTVAMPLASVVALAPVSEPPPEPIENVTATPETGLPYVSVTSTDGAVPTVVFTVAVWPSPPAIVIEPATPATPVAVKVIGLPARLPEVAVSVLAPAVWPSVQLPTVAMPLAFVVGLRPVAEPPPEATAKVTAMPETGLP